MAAVCISEQASCSWPNERGNAKRKASDKNNKDQESWRCANFKINKPKNKTRDKVVKADRNVVRVACPYYIKDPNKYHDTASCHGAGFKEVAKLKDHLKDIHSLSPTLLAQLNFKQRQFLALKSLQEKWKLAFHILFPDVPKDRIPAAENPRPFIAHASPLCRDQKKGDDGGDDDGDGYVRVEDVRKAFYERVCDMFGEEGVLRIEEFVRVFGGVFEGAVGGEVRKGGGEVARGDGGRGVRDEEVKVGSGDANFDFDEWLFGRDIDGYHPQLNMNESYSDMNNGYITPPCAAQNGVYTRALAMHGFSLSVDFNGHDPSNYSGHDWHNASHSDTNNERFAHLPITYPLNTEYTPTNVGTNEESSHVVNTSTSHVINEGPACNTTGIWKLDGSSDEMIYDGQDDEVLFENWLVPLENSAATEFYCDYTEEVGDDDWKVIFGEV